MRQGDYATGGKTYTGYEYQNGEGHCLWDNGEVIEVGAACKAGHPTEEFYGISYTKGVGWLVGDVTESPPTSEIRPTSTPASPVPAPADALPEAEMLADLGAVPLDRPPGPVIARQVRRIGLHRPGQEFHRIRMQLAAVGGKRPYRP